ncbi:hypothetical protein F1880_007600 [Penicillium rolfsii]|nr:hypothetical protein F1880_007600 [Penicillium rolfsii]
MISEAQSLRHNEFEMSLFQAKLSYYSTCESHIASPAFNLKSITKHQRQINKQ